MTKRLQLKYDSVEDRSTLLGVLYAKGAIFHRGTNNYSLATACKSHLGWDEIELNDDNGGLNIVGKYGVRSSLNWSNDPAGVLAAIEEFINPSDLSVKLESGDYEVIVSKAGLQVGCQTISFKKFKEIASAVRKVEKLNREAKTKK